MSRASLAVSPSLAAFLSSKQDSSACPDWYSTSVSISGFHTLCSSSSELVTLSLYQVLGHTTPREKEPHNGVDCELKLQCEHARRKRWCLSETSGGTSAAHPGPTRLGLWLADGLSRVS